MADARRPRDTRRSYGSGRLFLRTDTAGVETWYGSWWAGSRRVKRKLGRKRRPATADGLTRAQAEAELRRRIAEAPPAQPGQRPTFREVAERHLDHLATVLDRKLTTLQDYRIILTRHLYPRFGDSPVDRISAPDITDYMAAKRREGLSANTVRNHINLLHGVLRTAVRSGLLTANPADQVDRPRPGGRRARLQFLTPKQLDQLLEAVPADPLGAVERVLYATAAMTGLRQGELLALRWSDVDFKAGRLRVNESYTRGHLGTPKSRTSVRSVPLAGRVADELHQHKHHSPHAQPEDFAFAHPHTGHVMDPSRLRKRFLRTLDRADIPRIRFHDLRHTFGTQMAAAGAPLRAIQEWMGHSDPATTAIYAHYAPDPTNGAALVNRAFTTD